MKRLFFGGGKKKAEATKGDCAEKPASFSMVEYFSVLDPWLKDPSLSEPIVKFLAPVIAMATDKGNATHSDNDGSADFITAQTGRFVDELVGEVRLSEEERSHIKPVFDKFLAFFQSVHDEINCEEGIFQELKATCQHSRIDTSHQNYIEKFYPDYALSFEMGNKYLAQALSSRISGYLYQMYQKIFSSDDLRRVTKTLASPTENFTGIHAGLSLTMKDIEKSYWSQLRTSSFKSMQRSQQQGTDAWAHQSFISGLLKFKEDQGVDSLVDFLNHFSYITNHYQGMSEEALTESDLEGIYRAAIDLNVAVNMSEYPLESLTEIVCLLRNVEEKLKSSTPESDVSDSMVMAVAEHLMSIPLAMFAENKVEMTAEKGEKLFSTMKQFAADQVLRVYQFIQLMQTKILSEIAAKQADAPNFPVREGLQQGFGGMSDLQRKASVTAANILAVITAKSQSSATEINRPVVLKKLAGWGRFKAKYDKLSKGWKVVAGVLIAVGVIGIIAGLVFCPAVTVTVAVIGKASISTLVVSYSAALVGSASVGHIVHIAKQRLPDPETMISQAEMGGMQSAPKAPVLEQRSVSGSGPDKGDQRRLQETPITSRDRDSALSGGRRIDFSAGDGADIHPDTMIGISGAALVTGNQGTFAALKPSSNTEAVVSGSHVNGL